MNQNGEMNIERMFPVINDNNAANMLPLHAPPIGKQDSDDICQCFEQYTYLKLEEEYVQINLWRGSCCCFLGCCSSCINYNFISSLSRWISCFCCYRTIIMPYNEIVDVGYIFSGYLINESWKYWPVLVLKNKDLIIIGNAEELTDLTYTITCIKQQINFSNTPSLQPYEIPFAYKKHIIKL